MDDKHIISQCKELEAKYQKILLEKYTPRLTRSASAYVSDRHMVMDALQETWIIIFKQLATYEEKGYFFPWANKIMLRELFRISKRENLRLVHRNTELMIKGQQQPRVDKILELEEALKMVERIKSPAREVFKMYVIDGMSHKEIADIMGITASTSRVHLSNARKAIVNLTSAEQKKMKL